MQVGDGADDGARGAGVDAQQARVGERVAGQRLHQRAGQAQRGAHEHAGRRPGDPQVADDQLGLAAAAVEQRVPDLPRREVVGPDADAQDHDDQQRQRPTAPARP